MHKFESFIYGILDSKTKKASVLAAVFIAFIASILMFPAKLVLANMLPAKSANTFSVYIKTPKGSSITQTQMVAQCIIKQLQESEHITDMELFLGEGAPLNYAGLVKGSGMKDAQNLAEIVVNLSDKHSREIESFILVKQLRPKIKQSCSAVVEKSVIKMVEQPAGPPTLATVVVEIYGEDLEQMQTIAQKTAAIFKAHKDLVDVDIMYDNSFKKYELVLDKEKIIRASLSVAQVQQILYLAFEGMEVGVKNSEETPKQIPLFLILQDNEFQKSSKQALEQKLAQLQLLNKKGKQIPFSELVQVKTVQSTPTIIRKNLQRVIHVLAQTDNVSQVYPFLEVRQKMHKELEKEFSIEPAELFDYNLVDKQSGQSYEIKFDGEMKVTLDTFKDLGAAFIAALVLIFLLLVIYYKSFVLSGIVLLGSFLSIIGVIFGHWIMDIFIQHTFFLTATSLIGFIALMGISSRNSLLLIDFAKALIKQQQIEKQRAIAIATATRAKPIFLTAAAIILASTLLASDPVFGGLGVALIFGTIAAVVISLLFIPILMDNTKAL